MLQGRDDIMNMDATIVIAGRAGGGRAVSTEGVHAYTCMLDYDSSYKDRQTITLVWKARAIPASKLLLKQDPKESVGCLSSIHTCNVLHIFLIQVHLIFIKVLDL
jgi:hypothetical protein